MQVSTAFILICIYFTICTPLVFAEDKQTTISVIPNLTSFINMVQSLADDKFLPNKKSQIKQEICLNSLKKGMRYRKIIKLQEQLNLKMQSQLLEQIHDCSNLRQRVRNLIAKYQRLKMELKALKASGRSAKRTNVLVRNETIQ